MPKRVLIITPNFPPVNKVSSLRGYYLARAFANRGWDVEVLASSGNGEDQSLVREVSGFSITRTQDGLRWGVIQTILTLFYKRCKRSNEQINVVISTYGPSSSHVLGFFVKLLHHPCVWVADYRDLWCSGSYYGRELRGPISSIIVPFVERFLVKFSDFVVTVSSGLASNLSRFLGREVSVVYNGYESFIENIPQSHAHVGHLQICYTGTIYRERNPALLLETISELEEAGDIPKGIVRVVVAGRIDGDLQEELSRFVERELLIYKGFLSREDSYAIQCSSDYCLIAEDYQATKKGVVTGKVFEYIGSKKPIIALGVAPDSELADIINRAGLLAYCGQDKSDLAQFIRRAVSGICYKPNDEFISNFEREKQTMHFVDIVS